MGGIRILEKIQIGAETTAGTAAAATAIWRGDGMSKDDREIVTVDVAEGFMMGSNRTYVSKLGATVTFDEVPATFEQLPYILSAGIENITNGTQDGTTGSGYVYTFDVTTASQITPKTYTIEMGDSQEQNEMEYSYVESFTLSGAAGEPVMMACTWKGRQLTDCAFTASLTAPTVEEILFGKGNLYIDSTTLGTTTVSNSWVGFTLNVNTGIKGLHTGDGQLYFSTLKQTGVEITGDLMLEHDATGEAEIGYAQAETERKIRMQFLGSTLTTAVSWTYKTLRFNAAIMYTDAPAWDEQDGNNVVTLPFRVVYYSGATAPQFIVVNTTNTLP